MDLVALFAAPLSLLDIRLSDSFIRPAFGAGLHYAVLATLALWMIVGLLLGLRRYRVARILLVLLLAAHWTGIVLIWPAGHSGKRTWDERWESYPWSDVPGQVAAGAAVYLLGQVVILYLVINAKRRRVAPQPVLRPWQFSLRALLVLPVLLAVPLGCIVSERRRAARGEAAAVEIERLGGEACAYPNPHPTWERLLGRFFLAPLTGIFLRELPVSDDDLHVLDELPEVNLLHLSKTNISGAGLAHLRCLGNLGYLNVADTQVTDYAVTALESATELQVLHLEHTSVGDSALAHLRPLRKLTRLELAGTHVSDAGLAHLTALQDLESLNLYGTQITDAGLVHLKDLRRLRFLSLGETALTGHGLRDLEQMELFYVFLSRSQLTDAGLEPLGRMRGLCQLYIAGTRVTDDGLRHLGASPHLSMLDLSSTQITGAGLAHLAKLRSLYWLSLKGSRVTDDGLAGIEGLQISELDLSDTQISDAGLRHLKTLPRLTQFNLSNTRVTDQGLDEIVIANAGLLELRLENTQVTDEGVKRLKERCPWIGITR
jgi:Leucine-rich repeat (LRR) protein